jgi:nucleoid-associated protein YgaU
LPDWRGHGIPSDHAPPIKSMAFCGQFVKLVMGGLPARLRRCRPDALRSAAAARTKWEDLEARPRSKTSKLEMDMGLLRFVKAAGAKIFGATETAAAPPEQWEQEAEKHGLDVAQVEVKPAGKVALSGSAAATEEAEKIKPATDDPVGVATVQDNIAAAAEAAESKFYTVQPGDALGKIAAAEYVPGHAGEYHRIFEANKPLLSDPDMIYPGQVLRIPPLPG